MLPFLSRIRFGLMDSSFIRSVVAPTQLLEDSEILSLFQFLNHPEIPPKPTVEKVGFLRRRNAQNFVFSKKQKRKDKFEFPSIAPISLNKGHSTLIKASISDGESFGAHCKLVKFDMGTELALKLRILK